MKLGFANLLVLMIGFLFSGFAAAADVESGSITVHVTGLHNDKGVVRIALFNDKAAYSADKGSAEQSFKKAVADIKNREATYTFTDVPYGSYAIKLFHDEDNSGKFYTGMFGIPKVEYGFSNNAKAMLGPPSYEKALFKLSSKDLSMDLKTQGH